MKNRKRKTTPKINLRRLADELVACECFDIPGIVKLLHARVQAERQLGFFIAALRVPPLAQPWSIDLDDEE